MPDFNRDSVRNTLTIAIGLSLVCSVLVAATAVWLKPVQTLNEEEYRQRIILEVAGLMQPDAEVAALFAAIESRMVDLATGDYVESLHSDAAADDYAPVYLVKDGDALQQIILPVQGPGLWSTMYGYLSLESDGNTVRGLRFYDHAETPGLGDQVDKPEWRAQWVGKQIFGADGEPRIEVIRGVSTDRDSRFEIDGLSGATLTGRGVTQLVHYWTGPQGFGPYLQRIQSTDGDST